MTNDRPFNPKAVLVATIVEGFNRVMYLAAILSLLGGASALLLISGPKRERNI